jgi:hypothetical protein
MLRDWVRSYHFFLNCNIPDILSIVQRGAVCEKETQKSTKTLAA